MTRDSAPAPESSVPPQYTVSLALQYLSLLATQCQGDPDHLLTLRQFPRIALEASSPKGSKFWVGAARETGVSFRWGKMGSKGTLKHIALSRCRRRNPALELKQRVLAKLKEGYDLLPYETVLP